MIWLCLIVLDDHDYTQRSVASITQTVANADNVRVVIYDNGSAKLYLPQEFPKTLVDLSIVRSDRNKGYYYPLHELAEILPLAPDDLIVLAHNDLTYHEHGWDQALQTAFAEDDKLALVGFNGQWMIDVNGNRGIGSMINMHDEPQILPGHSAVMVNTRQADGSHIVLPVITIDSMFMAFRRTVISELTIDSTITLGHCYDRIWPLTLTDKGYHVGFMGVSINHYSPGFRTERHGPTAKRIEQDCKVWCQTNNIRREPRENWRQAHLREALHRMFSECGPRGQLPSWIDPEWNYHRQESGPKFGYWKEWNE